MPFLKISRLGLILVVVLLVQVLEMYQGSPMDEAVWCGVCMFMDMHSCACVCVHVCVDVKKEGIFKKRK